MILPLVNRIYFFGGRGERKMLFKDVVCLDLKTWCVCVCVCVRACVCDLLSPVSSWFYLNLLTTV